MSIETTTGTALRQRMIEDMTARNLGRDTQSGHIAACKRFAAWLKRSPETATADDVRLFQLHLIESGASICNRNRIMSGARFLFWVTLRRHDLAAEVWHMKEPVKLPPVLAPEEARRVLACARPTALPPTCEHECADARQKMRACGRHDAKPVLGEPRLTGLSIGEDGGFSELGFAVKSGKGREGESGCARGCHVLGRREGQCKALARLSAAKQDHQCGQGY